MLFFISAIDSKPISLVSFPVSEDNILTKFQTGRRSKLPVPKPDKGDVSLWNLLFRNIGKDLTKISMPVTLNEPLSMLQVSFVFHVYILTIYLCGDIKFHVTLIFMDFLVQANFEYNCQQNEIWNTLVLLF